MNQIFKLVSFQPAAKTASKIISINANNTTYNTKCSNKSVFYLKNQSTLNRFGTNNLDHSIIRSFCSTNNTQKQEDYDFEDESEFTESEQSVIEDYNDENGNRPKNMGYVESHFLDKNILNDATTPKYRFDPDFENGKYDFDEINRDQGDQGQSSNIETKPIEINDKQLPYDHSAKMAEKALRTHLNRFFLKVHPDLFFNNEEHRQINQRSLTQLNNLLRNLEEYVSVAEDSSNTTKLDKIPQQIQFRFFAEVDENGRIVEVKQEFTFVDAPDSILTSKSALVQYTTELRFNVYRQLYSLLEKSGISIPRNEKELLKNPKPTTAEINDDPWEQYFSKDPSKLSLSDQLNAFLDQFPVHNDTLRNQFAPQHQKLIDLFDEKKVYFYFGEQCKGDLDYMRHLGFREQAEFQIVHLKHNLLALEFADWSSLPIIVVDSKYYNLMEPGLTKRGFVVLEKDFDPTVAFTYIKEVVIPKTINNFNSIAGKALHNREVLEEKTQKLEQLFGSNVVIENLFSINQKTMDKVREDFNSAMTLVGELKIPAIQLLESNKAETWKDLPKTNLKEFEFEQWKLKNVESSEKDAIAFIAGREKDFVQTGRVSKFESEYQESERIQNTFEKIKNIQQQQQGNSDTRSVPLQLVDKSQFDVIQSTPFLNNSCSAVDRLTRLFEVPTKVPFLMADRPLKHPLAELKEDIKGLEDQDFEDGVFKAQDEEEAAIIEPDDENEDFDTEKYRAAYEQNKQFQEDNETYDDEAYTGEEIDEEGEVDEEETTPENLSKLSSMFSKPNIISVESKSAPSPVFISKINFMTTGNNFNNMQPIPISKPTISKPKDEIDEQLENDKVESSPKTEDEIPNVNNIIKETKQFDGISSDLEDFFSKLSQLEKDVTTPEKETPKPIEEDKSEDSTITTEAVESTPEEIPLIEKITYIEQKLSDFKWDGINLIISDHYRFIITEDNKSGFCFIPSNFKEEELFVFINSIQDSFDIINGGTKEKTEEEYRLKALLAIENNVNELKQRYRLKSVVINNNSVPSKAAQYLFVKKFISQMESSVESSQLATFKSIAPYITLVVSNEYSIDFTNDLGSIVDEKDYSSSRSAIVSVDNLSLNANVLLEYIFVTLSENSKFFRDLITRSYNVPTAPEKPSQEKVIEVINKELYGFDRIKDPNAPLEKLSIKDLKFIPKEESAFDELINPEEYFLMRDTLAEEYGEEAVDELLGELADDALCEVRDIKEDDDNELENEYENENENNENDIQAKLDILNATDFLNKINKDETSK
ncbi:hypothetical protein DICPUDRAFT_27199 [Dictyostelium purpureum]|uniref:DUF4460 domain-containing protein n=1 Tax=Dictyostelium purpureum TaxID=5786 RepID=F0Z9S3_DICPU|nr:uncharacterized protein DICPUDRAFT_27199 [Dictyostelium purpureum]EGC39260.1 hypothetical protein DICPUDRAFT_27199 [Dictyostelium purpureum]|eukprot:XP_003284164.1 hypothetical protein DICPUDRAFT_27199 [Dictyostelium purpureum]